MQHCASTASVPALRNPLIPGGLPPFYLDVDHAFLDAFPGQGDGILGSEASAEGVAGKLGKALHKNLQRALKGLGNLGVTTRLPHRDEGMPGVTVERVACAVSALKAGAEERYPLFRTEMGPVWAGTLQVIFPAVGG